MQKTIVAIALTGLMLCVFAASGSAQRVLGGYKVIKNTQAGVKEAAEFAVKTRGEKEEKEMELVSVLKAESQSVAGMNYRLCLKVSSEGGEGQDAVDIIVQTVVYVDLKKNYKLTSWAIADCAPEED